MSKMKRWQKVVAVFLVIVLFLGIVALYLLCPRTVNQEINNWTQDSFDIQSIKTIDKTKDDFTILAITDIQFDNPFYSKNDVKTAIKNMIDKTNLANVCQGLFSESCTEKRAH